MRGDFEDDDGPTRERPVFPTTVYAAGMIWIIIGSLILVNAVINMVMNAGLAAGGMNQATPGVVAVVIGFLFGVVFIHVGRQSTSGTARDTLGNAIGSLIIGLLNAAVGGFNILAAFAGGSVGILLGIVGTMSLLAGAGLIVAGILAIVGRADYKEWRRTQKKKKSREAD
jgi:hypothetical protein